jgi:hypothetical protein
MSYLNGEYLGDGAYAQQDEFGDIVLSTGCDMNYPISPDNVICLEDEVLLRLLKYVKLCKPQLLEKL